MKKLATILILSAAACTAPAENQEADSSYFHPAASLYIHGDVSSASNLVALGLSEYPNDAKLKRLKELLDQQQQNQQDQQDKDNQDQQNQDQQNQDQQNQDQQNQDQQNQDQQNPDQQNPDQQNPDQQNQDQQNPDQQNQDGQPQQPRAEEMTEDEARQLMDAMKQEEKNDRMMLHPVYGAPVRVDKDW